MNHKHGDILKWIYGYKFKAVQNWLKGNPDFFKKAPDTSFEALAAAINGEGAKDGLKMVELLVKHGADVKGVSPSGDCLLKWACKNQKEDVASFLIAKGASIHAQNSHGITPLMWAAHYNSPSLVKHLIGLGAQIDQRDEDGNSALIWATLRGQLHLEVIKTLVEAGAELEFKNNYKLNALGILGISNSPRKEEVIQYLTSIYTALQEKKELLTTTEDLGSKKPLAALVHKNGIRL